MPYRFGNVVIEGADVQVVGIRLRPAVLGTVSTDFPHFWKRKTSLNKTARAENILTSFQLRFLPCHSPSSGLMSTLKRSGQLTTTTSPTLAACQHVRLSQNHGHAEVQWRRKNRTKQTHSIICSVWKLKHDTRLLLEYDYSCTQLFWRNVITDIMSGKFKLNILCLLFLTLSFCLCLAAGWCLAENV